MEVMLAVVLTVVTLAVGSIVAVTHYGPLDWEKTALVAATASSVVSALALVGICFSLILQWRQVALDHEIAKRERLIELAKLAIENPRLRLPINPDGLPDDELDRFIYINMLFQHWHSTFISGDQTPEDIYGLALNLFRLEIARQWWTASRDGWLSTSQRKRSAPFKEAIDRALVEASVRYRQATGTARAEPSEPSGLPN